MQSIEIQCPFCHNTIKPYSVSKTSTGGVICILAGILLAPICIGIVLIIVGINMKEVSRICPHCRMKLN